MGENYIPPVLWISASEALIKRIRKIIAQLELKAIELKEQQLKTASRGSTDQLSLVLLKTIGSYIPALNHYLQVGRIHPEIVFTMLARLSGELLFLTGESLPREYPQYHHTDLAKSFDSISLTIQNCLGEVVSQRYVPIPLEKQDELFWVGSIPDSAPLRSGKFFLIVGGDRPDAELISEVPKLLRIGAQEDREVIHTAKTVGVPVQHVARPPLTLPLRPEHQYFELDRGSQYWKTICEKRNVFVQTAAKIQGLSLELVAIDE